VTTLHARVEGGKLVAPERAAFTAVVRGLADGDYVLTFAKPTRSSRANAYLWGVVYAAIGEHLGYSVEEVHDALKVQFRSREDLSTGLTIVRSTRTGSDDFWEYVDQVRHWSHTFLGVYIPEPNEREEAA
jgi:hypothetical protein